MNLYDGQEHSAGMDSAIIVDDINPDDSLYIIRFDKLTKPGPTMPIRKAIDKGARYSIAFDILCITMVTPTGWRAAAGVGEISVGTTDVFLAGGPIYGYKSMRGGTVVGYNFLEVRFWFSSATGFSLLN
jgi:hypothetical protein